MGILVDVIAVIFLLMFTYKPLLWLVTWFLKRAYRITDEVGRVITDKGDKNK